MATTYEVHVQQHGEAWVLSGPGAEGFGLLTDYLSYLAACRVQTLPGRPGSRGDNVFSIRDGRNTGLAPATINRRLTAISGLFAYRSMRDPTAPNPVPSGRRARAAVAGERTGLLGHLARPKARSRLRVREPRRLPRGWTGLRPPRCWPACARCGIGPSRA